MSKFIPDGFCDFAGCFNLIGKAEFGAEWTGEEFTAKKIPSPEERMRSLEKMLKVNRRRNAPCAVEGASGHSISFFAKPDYPSSKAELLKIQAKEGVSGIGHSVEPWEGLDPESKEYSKRRHDLLEATLRRDKTLEILRQRLYVGRIVALLLCPQREPEKVPMHEWASDDKWNTAVGSGRVEETNSSALIIFRIAKVETTISGTVATTIAAEKRCREWLAELMLKGPPAENKIKYKEEAKTKFGVGSKAFDRAWGNAKADSGNETWSKAGPKPKPSQ